MVDDVCGRGDGGDGSAWVMAPAQMQGARAEQLVETMVLREKNATPDQVRYAYLSEERSERTRGHLWTERMVETDWGTVRYLLAADGQALPDEQVMNEKGRLAEEAADPKVIVVRSSNRVRAHTASRCWLSCGRRSCSIW